jgi:chitinase
MAKIILFLLVIIVNYLEYANTVANPKVVCYYESWVYWRTGTGKMTVDNIDSSLCTHIVYAYLGITDSNTVSILDPYLMEDLNDLANFVKKKGSAKAMVAIGGSTQSTRYSTVAMSDSSRTTFVNSVVALLSKYHFDGVMLDWQYPNQAIDKDNYVHLLDKFDEKFAGTAFSLGITGSPNHAVVDSFFDVPKILNYVDFVHVLTLDYHGPWDSRVDYAAPLKWTIESLEYWWSKGAPKNKLLAAVPLFARTWKLANISDNEHTAAGSGGGAAGPYTQTSGLLSYNELCAMMKSSPSSFVIRRDPLQPAVYAVHGSDWISFEDTQTTTEKAHNITSQGFGGVVAYAIDNDDFHGDCGTKFALLNGLNKGLDHNAVSVGTPPPITTTTGGVTVPTVTTVTDDGTVFHCTKAGGFRDHINCRKYYLCYTNDLGLWEQNVLYCERNFAYDETAQKCSEKEVVPGCNV